MDKHARIPFNLAHATERYQRVVHRLIDQVGPIPFRIAETPLFLSADLRDALARESTEILAQLSAPGVLKELTLAVPPKYDAPGVDGLPNMVLVDFALVEGPEGLRGRVVELQAFPSVTAMMTLASDIWAEELSTVSGLSGGWSCFVGMSRPQALDLMRRTILGSCDPSEVVLVDIDPPTQKTLPDFVATKKLFGVDAVCITDIVKEGRGLFRRDGAGKLRPIRRIYNRMVFDELQTRGIEMPFKLTDELDVTWCPHPNWYWMWSKHSLPFVDHPAVPKTSFLADLKEIPSDLSKYVLKPVFSFAGGGVVVDVTRGDVDRIPANERARWVLQEKIEYAPVVETPEGGEGVKAEVRVVLMRPPDAPSLLPVMYIARLSRGKMLGVDHNKGFTWVGGSVAMWRER